MFDSLAINQGGAFGRSSGTSTQHNAGFQAGLNAIVRGDLEDRTDSDSSKTLALHAAPGNGISTDILKSGPSSSPLTARVRYYVELTPV